MAVAGAACCVLRGGVGGDVLSKVLTIIPALYFYPVSYSAVLRVCVCVFVGASSAVQGFGEL